MDDLLELEAITDEVLERAATTEQAFTLVYCTHHWHTCDWPQFNDPNLLPPHA